MFMTPRAAERIHMTRMRANLVFSTHGPGAAEALGVSRQEIVRRGLIGFKQAASRQPSSIK